jgi:hypothetical protein
VSARVTLGCALIALDRHDEGRAELEGVLRDAPDNLAAIRALAELHDRTDGSVGDEDRIDVAPDAHADVAAHDDHPVYAAAADEPRAVAADEPEEELVWEPMADLMLEEAPDLPLREFGLMAMPPQVESADVEAARAGARQVAALERWLSRIETRRAHRAVA